VGAGITGPVQLKGSTNGTTIDLSSQQWTYQVSRLSKFVQIKGKIVYQNLGKLKEKKNPKFSFE
jgi:hypothetical protein